MNTILQSSKNDGKQSLTISGLLILSVPLFIQFLQNQGIEMASTDLIQLIESATLSVGAIATLLGAIRKVWNSFKK